MRGYGQGRRNDHMKKTLFIHAGTEKTGSTSLQHFLMTNGTILEDNGFHFLRSGGVGGTGAIQFTATLCRPKMRLGELTYQNTHVLQRRLIAEVRQSNCARFIISSEHLHSQVNSPDQLDELMRLFSEAGITEFKVVFYIRNQIDLIRSHYSTQIKGGGAHTHRDAFSKLNMKRLVPKAMSSYGNYYRMLDLWSCVFGKENIMAKNYDKTDDVVASFLDMIGIPSPISAVMQNAALKLNTSLDRTSLYILSCFQKRYPKNREIYAWLKETLQDLKFKYETDSMPLTVQFRIWLHFLWSNYQLGRTWPELRGLSWRGFVWGKSFWFRQPTDIETDLLDLFALLGKKKLDEADTTPTMLLSKRESMGKRGVLYRGCDAGFHKPEEWGSWTKDHVASLSIKLPACNMCDLQRIVLHIRLRSFYKDGDVSSLSNIFMNEELIYSGPISHNFEVIFIDVPISAIVPGLSNRLLFETNRLISPSEVGVSSDSRKLGLGISHLELQYFTNETNMPVLTDHQVSHSHDYDARQESRKSEAIADKRA
jgi:hypothetical protein